MPIQIKGKMYYRTLEICTKTCVSRATLFRWLKNGVVSGTYRDRRGWRLFTEDDIKKIQAEAERIERR